MRSRWRAFEPAGVPAGILSLPIVRGVCELLDWISRGDTMIRIVSFVPPWLGVVIDPVLLIVGFGWLWWITKETRTRPILLNPDGKPITSRQRTVVMLVDR